MKTMVYSIRIRLRYLIWQFMPFLQQM